MTLWKNWVTVSNLLIGICESQCVHTFDLYFKSYLQWTTHGDSVSLISDLTFRRKLSRAVACRGTPWSGQPMKWYCFTYLSSLPCKVNKLSGQSCCQNGHHRVEITVIHRHICEKLFFFFMFQSDLRFHIDIFVVSFGVISEITIQTTMKQWYKMTKRKFTRFLPKTTPETTWNGIISPNPVTWYSRSKTTQLC